MGEKELLLYMIYGWIWIMGEAHKNTDTQTDKHLNIMTQPCLAARAEGK